jgi:hypothetical protein
MNIQLIIIVAGFVSTSDGFSLDACEQAKRRLEAAVNYPITVMCVRKQ